MMTTTGGKEVLRIASDGRSIYLIGDGASPEGVRPFLDRFDVETKKATRLFRSDAPYYELPVDIGEGTLITRRESVNEPPNWFLRDLQTKSARALTSLPNPT